MKINNANLKFTNTPKKRSSTNYLFLHHAASKSCSVSDIHNWHLANGWYGIGYHFFIRKDGSVWQGRPIDTIGSHAGSSYNPTSIAICFEGNFETETMNTTQFKAGQQCIQYILEKYTNLNIVRHKDKNSTACPGKNFPFNEIINISKLEEDEPVSEDELYKVQVGAFKEEENAEKIKDDLNADGYDTYMVKKDGLYKVQTGAFKEKENAQKLEKELEEKGFDTYIVKSGEVKTELKSVDEVAREVINGKWGNGDERERLLKEAGYNYNDVQSQVNKILS